jgi:hypothetical protein
MDVSTFMFGYFTGLIVGAVAIAMWTASYGKISPKSLSLWWHDMLGWMKRADETHFASRRKNPPVDQMRHPAE